MAKRVLASMILAAAMFSAGAAGAGEVDVLDVKVRKQADGRYQFSVTLSHADTGWEHYADKWEVLTPDGRVLGTRVLLHPHVDEQPFTRDLGNVRIPERIKEVVIRGHDRVHGTGGKTMTVRLPGR